MKLVFKQGHRVVGYIVETKDGNIDYSGMAWQLAQQYKVGSSSNVRLYLQRLAKAYTNNKQVDAEIVG